ncbi:hypothetical protein B1B_17944 [mine drainage metagenome]|uniref:Uncharacterized protein n=1 Tax=mine drainage metagenome TaxID=410659 RepID=T0Y9M0_9ZZZZ
MLAICRRVWWYLYMAFIVGKKQNGKTYYYLAESARVEGKPRIVSQRYLGSAVGDRRSTLRERTG